MTGAAATILLVEDNDLDVERIRRCFARLNSRNTMIHARDGIEALEALRGAGAHARLPRPDLILLDLNLPRMGGLEFLGALRADAELANTKVCVLTTSDFHRDIAEAHRHHVCGYVVKPESANQMIETVAALKGYWEICKFP